MDRRGQRRAAAVLISALALSACAGEAQTPGAILFQGPFGLALVEADGSGLRDALPIRFGSDALHADWSPDGTRIIFAFDDEDGTRDLYVAEVGGSQSNRAEPELLVDCVAPCRDVDNPAWSPDGTRISYHRVVHEDGIDLGSTVELVDPATGTVEVIAATPTEAWAGATRWAPDGNRLAVELLRWKTPSAEETEVTGSAIAVIDLESDPAQVRPITDFEMYARYPDWHPTEDLIVFQSGDGDPFLQTGSPQDLFTVRPDGSELTRLTQRTPEQPWLALPAWHSDGRGILVTAIRGPGDHAMQTLDAEGGNPVDLVDPVTEERIVGAHARQAPALD